MCPKNLPILKAGICNFLPCDFLIFRHCGYFEMFPYFFRSFTFLVVVDNSQSSSSHSHSHSHSHFFRLIPPHLLPYALFLPPPTQQNGPLILLPMGELSKPRHHQAPFPGEKLPNGSANGGIGEIIFNECPDAYKTYVDCGVDIAGTRLMKNKKRTLLPFA
jgi:hypothetical protein